MVVCRKKTHLLRELVVAEASGLSFSQSVEGDRGRRASPASQTSLLHFTFLWLQTSPRQLFVFFFCESCLHQNGLMFFCSSFAERAVSHGVPRVGASEGKSRFGTREGGRAANLAHFQTFPLTSDPRRELKG